MDMMHKDQAASARKQQSEPEISATKLKVHEHSFFSSCKPIGSEQVSSIKKKLMSETRGHTNSQTQIYEFLSSASLLFLALVTLLFHVSYSSKQQSLMHLACLKHKFLFQPQSSALEELPINNESFYEAKISLQQESLLQLLHCPGEGRLMENFFIANFFFITNLFCIQSDSFALLHPCPEVLQDEVYLIWAQFSPYILYIFYSS